MSPSKNQTDTSIGKVDSSAGSFAEVTESNSTICSDKCDGTSNELQNQQQTQGTPQKPVLKSVEKMRVDTTPELPVFKSQTHRTLNYDRQTPRAAATVFSPGANR